MLSAGLSAPSGFDRARQGRAGLLFLGPHLGEVGLQLGHLRFELLAVGAQHAEETSPAARAVSRGLSYMSSISFASVSFSPSRLARSVRVSRGAVARGCRRAAGRPGVGASRPMSS